MWDAGTAVPFLFHKMSQTKLLPFEESTLEFIPSEPGIYKVFSKKSFVRLSGKKTKIVYIGKANNLRDRVPSLWKGTKRSAKRRFDILLQNEKYKNLYVRCYYPYPNPKEKERKVLEQFEKDYLELPPLNHNK
jgi:hypothetical protein